MNFDNQDDKKLASFLKENQATPPNAKADEEAKILSAVENEKAKPEDLKIGSWWIPAAVVAASFLLGIMIFNYPVEDWRKYHGHLYLGQWTVVTL